MCLSRNNARWYRRRARRVTLDERLGRAGIVADGPAVRRRCARRAEEIVSLRETSARRIDDGPRGPIPPLDERLINAAGDVVADRPAVRHRRAGHATEEVTLCGAGVR